MNPRSRLHSRVVLLTLVAMLTLFALGCPNHATTRSVSIYAESAAPPARKLEVVTGDSEHRVLVTSGVAFAASLSDNCPYDGAPTPRSPPTMTIADASILASRPLVRGTSDVHFVLWGVKPGRTTITLQAWCATQTYEVTVAPP